MTVFIIIFLLLCINIAVMSFSLRKSMKETLYSYKNILLISGIIFTAAFLIAMIWGFFKLNEGGSISALRVYSIMRTFPENFSYYAVFIMTLISFLLFISNIALIRHEGLRAKNILSIAVALFYVGGTILIYQFIGYLGVYVFTWEWIPSHYIGYLIYEAVAAFLLYMIVYFECVFISACILGYMAARHKPSHDKDYVIILGCAISKKGQLLPLLKGRVNRAIRFAWEQEMDSGIKLEFVPSGGQGPDEVMSEGSAMELYMLSKGVEDYEIHAEKESLNTYENFRNSKKIIDALNPHAKIMFATTNYHILRSGIIARSVGLDAEGVAGDTKWYFWPNGFIREFIAILTMNIKTHMVTAGITLLSCVIFFMIGGYYNFI